IAIPKLPSLQLAIFSFIDVQQVIEAPKRKVDMRIRPNRCHARSQFGVMEFARRIVVKFHPFRMFPGGFGEIAIGHEVHRRMRCFGFHAARVGLLAAWRADKATKLANPTAPTNRQERVVEASISRSPRLYRTLTTESKRYRRTKPTSNREKYEEFASGGLMAAIGRRRFLESAGVLLAAGGIPAG